MVCASCKVLTGREITHANNECDQANSFLCKRCHTRGHLTRHCKAQWSNWERPTCLEELISPDIRMRYGIDSQTPIKYKIKRGDPGTETELGDSNEITISSDYTELLKFAKKHNINVDESDTKPSAKHLIVAITKWGVARGYRIVERIKP